MLFRSISLSAYHIIVLCNTLYILRKDTNKIFFYLGCRMEPGASYDLSMDSIGVFHFRGGVAVPSFPHIYNSRIGRDADRQVREAILHVDLHFAHRSEQRKKAIVRRRLQGNYKRAAAAVRKERQEGHYRRLQMEARQLINPAPVHPIVEESEGSLHTETSTSTPIPISPQYEPGLLLGTPWDLIMISSDSKNEDPFEGLGGVLE